MEGKTKLEAASDGLLAGKKCSSQYLI